MQVRASLIDNVCCPPNVNTSSSITAKKVAPTTNGFLPPPASTEPLSIVVNNGGAAASSSSRPSTADKPKNYKIKNTDWYCVDCDTYCNSPLQHEVHILSQKHKNRLIELSQPPKPAVVEQQEAANSLVVVASTTSSTTTTSTNLSGESSSVAQQLVDGGGSAVVSTSTSTTTTNTVTNNFDENNNKLDESKKVKKYIEGDYRIAHQYHIDAEKYLLPDSKRCGKYEKFGYYCERCDAYMTGQIQLVMHVKGARHQYYFPGEIPNYKPSKEFNPNMNKKLLYKKQQQLNLKFQDGGIQQVDQQRAYPKRNNNPIVNRCHNMSNDFDFNLNYLIKNNILPQIPQFPAARLIMNNNTNQSMLNNFNRQLYEHYGVPTPFAQTKPVQLCGEPQQQQIYASNVCNSALPQSNNQSTLATLTNATPTADTSRTQHFFTTPYQSPQHYSGLTGANLSNPPPPPYSNHYVYATPVINFKQPPTSIAAPMKPQQQPQIENINNETLRSLESSFTQFNYDGSTTNTTNNQLLQHHHQHQHQSPPQFAGGITLIAAKQPDQHQTASSSSPIQSIPIPMPHVIRYNGNQIFETTTNMMGHMSLANGTNGGATPGLNANAQYAFYHPQQQQQQQQSYTNAY